MLGRGSSHLEVVERGMAVAGELGRVVGEEGRKGGTEESECVWREPGAIWACRRRMREEGEKGRILLRREAA